MEKDGNPPTHIFQKTVLIDSTPSRVWDCLTIPSLIKEWMAETEIDIVTDWEPGSSITIRGDLHGIHFENTGRVLQVEHERLLAYSHLSSLSGLPDMIENYSVVEFRLSPKEDRVSLTITVSNFPTEVIYRHLAFYWNVAIESLRKFAEGNKEAV